MFKMEDIEIGNSYACKFRVTTMLDELGRPAPNLSDVPLKGPGEYESLGVIKVRDSEQKLVELEDTITKKNFVVSWENCWDIDTVEWKDPLESQHITMLDCSDKYFTMKENEQDEAFKYHWQDDPHDDISEFLTDWLDYIRQNQHNSTTSSFKQQYERNKHSVYLTLDTLAHMA